MLSNLHPHPLHQNNITAKTKSNQNLSNNIKSISSKTVNVIKTGFRKTLNVIPNVIPGIGMAIPVMASTIIAILCIESYQQEYIASSEYGKSDSKYHHSMLFTMIDNYFKS